jgi:hypothetical protein
MCCDKGPLLDHTYDHRDNMIHLDYVAKKEGLLPDLPVRRNEVPFGNRNSDEELHRELALMRNEARERRASRRRAALPPSQVADPPPELVARL